mmetsp:Transcript_49179/g.73102  ORF Transcript_49179/g.73102 Transcript_49179/m.73102 type:complete len:198 (+) Transcript_49179:83-676(+)|eukprot:CAMPEP_0195517620 /NCGR_PEP_ID=MMETSP0794_2-20130614/11072_1 /TAXON_ID=515487 /ORGANISM="Stephanopyxis turris, Strain CCMP 815" /LENGTH=197 /DNA_ID=CAMNT_0040646447 /DNA_START=78 /DNA_END=671 /DNA_ORIENTATION=-
MKLLVTLAASGVTLFTIANLGMPMLKRNVGRRVSDTMQHLDMKGKTMLRERIKKDMKRGDVFHFDVEDDVINEVESGRYLVGKIFTGIGGFHVKCTVTSIVTGLVDDATSFGGSCSGSSNTTEGVVLGNGAGRIDVYGEDDFAASMEMNLAGQDGVLEEMSAFISATLPREQGPAGKDRTMNVIGEDMMGTDNFVQS